MRNLSRSVFPYLSIYGALLAPLQVIRMSTQDRLYTLASSMSGTFSSQAQADGDENFLNINLSMEPIWSDRQDGYFFYVEQAASSSPNRPYRQRIYQVTFSEGDEQQHGEFVSRILEFPEFLNGYHYEACEIGLLELSHVKEMVGCRLVIRDQGSYFTGSTIGSGCKNSWGGACFVTSEVSIYPDLLESLDRGYAEDCNQVWGSEHGPYRFVKNTNIPLAQKEVRASATS